MMILLTGAALAVAQAPHSAGDAACLLAAIPPAERAAIARAGYAGGESAAADASIDTAVSSCAQRLGWDQPRARVAIPLAVATIIRDDARTVLAGRGVSVDSIDRWFAAQSVAVRTTSNPSDADLERMMDALREAGVSAAQLEENAGIVGGYFGARIMIERVERGLPFD